MSSTTQTLQLEPAPAPPSPASNSLAQNAVPCKPRNPAPYYLNIDEIPVMAPF